MSRPWAEIQAILRRRGYGLGNTGPLKDGVDGQPGKLTGTAILAELLKGETNQPVAALTPRRLKDPAAFFSSLRTSGLFVKGMEQPQVDGLNFCLDACGDAGWPIAWTAYALATAYWETAHTMQPVREAYWLSEDWRKKNLRYYPHYGRGYVQLTWPVNYQRADDELNLGGKLVQNLDLAMDCEVAAKIMVRGMQEGWFTKKKLAHTLPSDRPATFEELKASRPIINGRDKDDEIANVAMRMQAGLQAGGWA